MLRLWEPGYFSFNQYNRDQWMARQALRVPKGARVLDAGAGKGLYRHLFSHCDYRTQDFEREPSTIGKYTKLDFKSDITAIPVPNCSFDAIICTEVLEHVPDPVKVLIEFNRILTSNGLLLLSAPLCSFLHQEPYHFYGGFTPYWYRKYLKETFFDIESIERNRGFFSLFGQESRRFSDLIQPGQIAKVPLGTKLLLITIWLVTLPFTKALFPLLGGWIDNLKLETIATVGYHVIARKSA